MACDPFQVAVPTRDDQAALPDTSRERASVFISYAREDEGIVTRLGSALRANGRDVWVDTEDIRGTEEWARAIDAGIDSSDAIAFVLGPAFLASVQCRRELEYAVQKGKRLVPLLAHQVDPADVPSELGRLNWITIGDVDPAAVGALEQALDTDLDWVRTHTDLLVRAVAWETRNEDSGLLLRGRPLADAERFLATAAGKEPPPAPLHIRYVLAGRRAATRRQRSTIAVVTVFLLVAVALAALALVQRNRAVHESNLATSRELARSSTDVTASDPELARLLAVEAMERAKTPEAIAALRRAVAQPAIRLDTAPGTTLVTLSPDGNRAALRRRDETLDVLDVASGRPIASGLKGTSSTARVVFAPGGRWLAATTDGGDVILWDLQQDRRQRVEGQFATLAFSEDGSQLLLVERRGTVAIVDPRSPGRRITLPADADESFAFGLATAAFAPRGDLVVTWNEDSPRTQVWDARTGDLRSVLRHGANITDADISANGDLALTAGRDMTVRFWDPTTGAERGRSLTIPTADNDPEEYDIAAASFSPQSSAVVATQTYDHLQVWDARDAELQLNLPNRFDDSTRQGFGPQAPYLLTGSGIHDWAHDRTIVEPPMRVALLQGDGAFQSVERLGDRYRVWSGQAESTLIDFERSAWDVSSARGRVAVGYTDGTAEVRHAGSGKVLLRVPRRDSERVGVELSPDGRKVAVNQRVDLGGRGGVELWDVERRERRSLDESVHRGDRLQRRCHARAGVHEQGSGRVRGDRHRDRRRDRTDVRISVRCWSTRSRSRPTANCSSSRPPTLRSRSTASRMAAASCGRFAPPRHWTWRSRPTTSCSPRAATTARSSGTSTPAGGSRRCALTKTR